MKEIFYIRGNENKPEYVKEKLLEKYPSMSNVNDYCFDDRDAYYYNSNGEVRKTTKVGFISDFLEEYGTEIKLYDGELYDRVAYYPILKSRLLKKEIERPDVMFDSIQEAIDFKPVDINLFVIGYEEVHYKSMI